MIKLITLKHDLEPGVLLRQSVTLPNVKLVNDEDVFLWAEAEEVDGLLEEDPVRHVVVVRRQVHADRVSPPWRLPHVKNNVLDDEKGVNLKENIRFAGTNNIYYCYLSEELNVIK